MKIISRIVLVSLLAGPFLLRATSLSAERTPFSGSAEVHALQPEWPLVLRLGVPLFALNLITLAVPRYSDLPTGWGENQ